MYRDFKSLNNLNPPFMLDIFQRSETNRPVRSQYVNNLKTLNFNTKNFGEKCLRSLGPKIWNTLPSELKSCNSLKKFKTKLKEYDFSHSVYLNNFS